jgi:hypothetical protein
VAEGVDVADAVAVEGDTDEVASPLRALLAACHVAGVDHVVQRRIGVVDRGCRREGTPAPDGDSFPDKCGRLGHTFRRQKVEGTAVVVIAPTAPSLGRLE